VTILLHYHAYTTTSSPLSVPYMQMQLAPITIIPCTLGLIVYANFSRTVLLSNQC
jgi:hypothetical protein